MPALLWLLAQWTLPLALAATGSAQPAAGEAPFAMTVICTPAGAKTVPAPAGGPHDGGPAPFVLAPFVPAPFVPAPFVKGCAWCQSFGAVAVPPPPADELPMELSLQGAAAFGGQGRFFRAAADTAGFLSRAPPA